MKIENDRYYTPKILAKRLIDTTYSVLKEHGHVVTDVIEPSAGSGSFSNQIDCMAYDICPQSEGVIQVDFLKEPIEYRKGRLCIGNPPFGHGNTLSVKFYKKCCGIGDYIAFIQPISQLNNNLQMYYFDLIYSEDLGIVEYSSFSLHCCFNIYVRPENGQYNKKPDYRLKDVTLREFRREDKHYDIPDGYDYSFCNWGNGSFGKRSEYIGQYAQEIYVYVNRKELLPKVLELLEFENLRGYARSVSMLKMSRMRVYKYLKENIEGIE